MLDDHILKAQTMHSSAYIKPFEEEMKEWEDKLISMQASSFKSTGQLVSIFRQQDILDAWLRCQESWLYLEPIFNSEDIMKQMPVEGRKFNKVNIDRRLHSQDLQQYLLTPGRPNLEEHHGQDGVRHTGAPGYQPA